MCQGVHAGVEPLGAGGVPIVIAGVDGRSLNFSSGLRAPLGTFLMLRGGGGIGEGIFLATFRMRYLERDLRSGTNRHTELLSLDKGAIYKVRESGNISLYGKTWLD
jgi:hypothetical protein